ncbi:hypothetical protein RFI_21878 [Reticulomyxa filosa]|uniref:Uncharacterized protein n=1 Tax=Reticulomyxa filosa TaxID=46433 RepID=X6MP96_RETFI|nr:hypothetical protein RFI_21878 [Reticulomyxa filosa]|eukprot:ETO15486.1 hypothetical protein RFI_21878 [Reticulomyxa filosa]
MILCDGSADKSVRLWDIRSGQQIQMFNGHTGAVWFVEYSPFVINDSIGNSNVICSGPLDNTIRFWDIRSNKTELYMIKGDGKDGGIRCLTFLQLKKNEEKRKINDNICCDINLCYGSYILFADLTLSEYELFQSFFLIKKLK